MADSPELRQVYLNTPYGKMVPITVEVRGNGTAQLHASAEAKGEKLSLRDLLARVERAEAELTAAKAALKDAL
jgi:hypothetical protein